MRIKFGLKIWSINYDSFKRLSEIHKNGLIDYVELYTYPESFNKKALSFLTGIPIILHAPTIFHGMNLGDSLKKRIIEDISQYKSFLKTNLIIFHPGVVVSSRRQSIEKTIRNIHHLKNEFDIILENVPAIGIDNKTIMLAANPDEFKKIINETKVKTCLDFGHAIMSANYINEDPFKYIQAFLKNKPHMFHLSDGNFSSHIDSHLAFNEGSFPLEKIIGMIPEGSRLSLETPKKDFKQLSEDLSNLKIIKNFIPQSCN